MFQRFDEQFPDRIEEYRIKNKTVPQSTVWNWLNAQVTVFIGMMALNVVASVNPVSMPFLFRNVVPSHTHTLSRTMNTFDPIVLSFPPPSSSSQLCLSQATQAIWTELLQIGFNWPNASTYTISKIKFELNCETSGRCLCELIASNAKLN